MFEDLKYHNHFKKHYVSQLRSHINKKIFSSNKFSNNETNNINNNTEKSNVVIHLIGIGGIGMSALARILSSIGYIVQGSDKKENYITQSLIIEGIKIFIGHNESNLSVSRSDNNIHDNTSNFDTSIHSYVSLIVKSSCIDITNIELCYALEKNIKVLTRAEMLTILMHNHHTVCVAGTHGKTTTTAMIESIMNAAKMSPTVMNGGIINRKQLNGWLGSGTKVTLTNDHIDYNINNNKIDNNKVKITNCSRINNQKVTRTNTILNTACISDSKISDSKPIFISETDESDGSFLTMPTTIGIITNVDPEHLDHYSNFENQKQAFEHFVSNIQPGGTIIVNYDHKIALEIVNRSINQRRGKSKIDNYHKVDQVNQVNFINLIDIKCITYSVDLNPMSKAASKLAALIIHDNVNDNINDNVHNTININDCVSDDQYFNSDIHLCALNIQTRIKNTTNDISNDTNIIQTINDTKNIDIKDNGVIFDLLIFSKSRLETQYKCYIHKNIFLKAYGIHNVSNAIASICASINCGININQIKRGLAEFSGVKRRFTEIGSINGVRIIDDYAHHPEEIIAVLQIAESQRIENDKYHETNFRKKSNDMLQIKQYQKNENQTKDDRKNQIKKNKIIVIFEPHKYSRLSNMFDDFVSALKKADVLFITDVYSAGETAIDGVNSKELIKRIKNSYLDKIENNEKIIEYLQYDLLDANKSLVLYQNSNLYKFCIKLLYLMQNGDTILCLGAGNITNLANALPKLLSSLYTLSQDQIKQNKIKQNII